MDRGWHLFVNLPTEPIKDVLLVLFSTLFHLKLTFYLFYVFTDRINIVCLHFQKLLQELPHCKWCDQSTAVRSVRTKQHI